MTSGTVPVGEVELWYEIFGEPSEEAVVLLSGATAQATYWWRPSFVKAFVQGGHHVVRFDNRDTGLSTWVSASYTLDDMAGDTVGLLDGLGIERAHLVGVSMGAMIAQLVAASHPARVLTLTSFASSPWLGDPSLPRPSDEYLAATTAPPPTTAEGAVAFLARIIRAMDGSRHPRTEEEARALAVEALGRRQNPACAHPIVTFSAPDRRDALARLHLPVLVVHGTEDPVIPLAHGHATAEVIPGARFLPLAGIGHALPEAVFAEVVPALLATIDSV